MRTRFMLGSRDSALRFETFRWTFFRGDPGFRNKAIALLSQKQTRSGLTETVVEVLDQVSFVVN